MGKIQLTVEYHLKNEGAKQQKYCYQYNADNQQCANNRPHECLHLLWILLIPEMLDTDIVIHAIIGGKLDKNGKGDIKCQLTIQCSGKIFCIGKQQHHTGQGGIILPMVNRAEAFTIPFIMQAGSCKCIIYARRPGLLPKKNPGGITSGH